MKPYDIVKDWLKLPWDLYEFQENTVNDLAPLPGAGYYMDTGIGKTPTSIVAALYKLRVGEVEHVVCLMPPILTVNWARNIAKIPGVTYVEYKGTPKKRAAIDLDANFILMGYQIFKRDYDYLVEKIGGRKIAIICDEAQALKNVASQTFKSVRDFALTNHILLLTGTPLSDPEDVYAYTRLVAPSVYRNLHQFHNIHVLKRDFFDKPCEWANLDLLRENLMVNSVRILKRDVLKDLPPVTYEEMNYDLAPKHLALYNELAEQQLKLLPSGDKIDLTQATALFHALGQIPANAEHFSGGEVESTILDVIDELMDELGDKKLVIFTTYKMTTKRVTDHCQKYGAVSIWSAISPAQKQKNIDTFVQDAQCRMIVMNWQAGGAGIDNLQHVCADMLFLELPFKASHFHQAVARLDRSGQQLPVNVRIAIAEKTAQWGVYQMVLENDSLINCCVRGMKDLKDVIHGKRV